MDAAGQSDLDHEPGERQVDRDLREQRRDRVAVEACRLRRHAELLIDDGRSDRGEADHSGEHSEVAGLRQEPKRLAAADSAFVARLRRDDPRAGSRAICSTIADADGERRGADEKKIVGAELVRR